MNQRNPQAAPAIDPKLVEWLDKIFPDRCPDEGHSDRKIWIDAGARKVVRRLIEELRRQQENILNVHP